MFKRTCIALSILVAMLCFGLVEVDARDIGNGSGQDGDFHESVFEPFSSDTSQTQVKPPKPPTTPTTTTEPTKPPVKPPTTTTETPVQQPLQPTVSETFNANDTWLIQWYLCGTDLESEDNTDGAASRDLKEMLAVNLPPNVKVLIQTGGTNQWKNAAFTISNNNIERFLYTSEGIQKVQSLSDASMGDPNTLADFLRYGAQSYPADHRIFVFWDHGRVGVGGICVDEKYNDDILSLNDLQDAFTLVYGEMPQSKPFELIAFDTCVTSTYEYANSIHKFAKYMVASEASLSNPGLYYTGWIGALSQNPAMNGRELGTKICDTFMEGVEIYDNEHFVHESWKSTMAVIDLAQIPALGKAYEDFGREALANTQQNAKSFYTAFGRAAMSRNTVRYNSYNAGRREVDLTNQVDLLTFAEEIKRQGVLRDTPDALTQAVINAVIYNKAGGKYSRGGGIAAYHHYSDYGGSFSDYDKQRPAPEPQKQFYREMTRSHGDVVEQLSQTEEQLTATDKSEGQKLGGFNNQKPDSSTERQEGFGAWVTEQLTPEEIDQFKEEFDKLFESLRSRGLLAEGQSLFELPPAEREKILRQMTPEEQSQIMTIYLKLMQKAQESFNIDIKRDGTLTVQCTPEQLQYMTNVRFLIGQAVENGVPDIGVNGTGFVYLGTSPNVEVDWAENKFSATFPTKWPTLNGVPVYIEVTAENAEYDADKNIIGGYNLYIIPIKINGRDCALEVAYDYTDKKYYILSVTRGIEDNGTVSRDSITIKPGDVITPVIPSLLLNEDNGQISLVFKSLDSGKSITVSDRLTVEDTPFKDGIYAFVFQFIDVNGDRFPSKTFNVKLDDGEIYSDVSEGLDFTPNISVDDQGNITFELPEDVQQEIRDELE